MTELGSRDRDQGIFLYEALTNVLIDRGGFVLSVPVVW
jgi:hypothetical protein